MLNGVQLSIMKEFASSITEQFTIRGISRNLKQNPSLIHRYIKPLIRDNLVTKNKHSQISLNYRENHPILAYAECLRSGEFLSRPKNKDIGLFAKDVIEKYPDEFFVFLIFGSTVTSNKPNDLDILFIADNVKNIDRAEKFMYNISRNHPQKFDINVVSVESVYEMLGKRDQRNILNEALNRHLILYGAEAFYRLIKKGRA